MALVIDTGVIFATLNADDPDHERCTELLTRTVETRVIPDLALVELDYWLRKAGAGESWLTICEDIAAGGYVVHHLSDAELVRCAGLQARYADLRLGVIDAAVFTTCETLGERKVATLDHRDFGALRTTDGEALTIVP